jgi:hypothetical protein
MYAVGLAYYFLVARRRRVAAAPEELAARAGQSRRDVSGDVRSDR